MHSYSIHMDMILVCYTYQWRICIATVFMDMILACYTYQCHARGSICVSRNTYPIARLHDNLNHYCQLNANKTSPLHEYNKTTTSSKLSCEINSITAKMEHIIILIIIIIKALSNYARSLTKKLCWVNYMNSVSPFQSILGKILR